MVKKAAGIKGYIDIKEEEENQFTELEPGVSSFYSRGCDVGEFGNGLGIKKSPESEPEFPTVEELFAEVAADISKKRKRTKAGSKMTSKRSNPLQGFTFVECVYDARLGRVIRASRSKSPSKRQRSDQGWVWVYQGVM